MNSNFPKQYCCNNKQKIQMLTWPYMSYKTSTTALPSAKVTHKSCINFLADCLFPAFCPFLNSVFRVKLHLPWSSAGSSLPSQRVQDKKQPQQRLFQFISCQCLEFVSQTLFGVGNVFFKFPSLLWIFCSMSEAATHEYLFNSVSWARKQNYTWLINSALSVNAETVGVFWGKMDWEA